MEESRGLAGNLLSLRQSNPIIQKQGTEYRIFSNWLEYMQHLYTNGIARFQPFISALQERVPALKGLFPKKGNPFVSTSELPTHAFRYAMGVKEPYNKYTLPARRDKSGRPEKPYRGKLYVTRHPPLDFTGWNKPNIIREMNSLGSVTTGSAIGPELEVSFLGKLHKDRFVYSQKTRVPSFHKKAYPYHYQNKYGINKETYDLIYNIFQKYGFDSSQRQEVENYLNEYLSMYHSVRIILWQINEADAGSRVIIFLDDKGSFTTQIPAWDISQVRDDVSEESKMAQDLVKTGKVKEVFHAPGGKIFAGKQVKIFEVSSASAVLSKTWQQRVADRRRSSFGGKTPPPAYELSKLSGNSSFSFDGAGTDLSFHETSRTELDASDIFSEDDMFDEGFSSQSRPSFSPIVSAYGSSDEDSWEDPPKPQSSQPKLVPMHDGSPAWNIDVEADGNCLYYSLIMGYLLPHIDNENEFNIRANRIFGEIDTNTLRTTMQGYDGTSKWVKDHLLRYISGLREKLALKLIDCEGNEALVKRIVDVFPPENASQKVTTEIIIKYILGKNSWGNLAEAMLFSMLAETNIHYFNTHENYNIHTDGSITNEVANVENVIRVKYIDLTDGEGHKAGHFHFIIPRSQINSTLNSRLELLNTVSLAGDTGSGGAGFKHSSVTGTRGVVPEVDLEAESAVSISGRAGFGLRLFSGASAAANNFGRGRELVLSAREVVSGEGSAGAGAPLTATQREQVRRTHQKKEKARKAAGGLMDGDSPDRSGK